MQRGTYVIPFSELRMTDVGSVGGKNASLGEMLSQLTEEGIRVPDGFATTADAFREFLHGAGLVEKINACLDALDIDDVKALAATGAQIRRWVEEAPFPAALETEIRSFYQWLASESSHEISVAVRSSAAAEGIGKTSLQHQLKKRLMQLKDPQFAFFPVFIDLQGTPEDRFFMTLRDEIRHELAPQFGADFLVSAVPDGYPCDYRDLIRELNSIIKLLAARTNKRVKLVLLIDEIDQLNDYDPRINQRLRSLFMRDFSENLAAVVSGVSIKKQWAGEGSPWYNFFEEIEVKPLSREDAEKLIKRPVRGRFKLKKGVVERILSSTGCKPYLIQKTCIALVNKMYNEGRRTIGPADVDGIGWPSEE